MLREFIQRLLGEAPPPCGWPRDKVGNALLPVSIEHQLGMIRWNNTISAVSITADLEAMEYLPREFDDEKPANDYDPETHIETMRVRRVA